MFKKISVLFACMLLLTACSTSKNVDYKNDVALYKLDGKTVYESNYYDFLVSNDKGLSIYTAVVTQINENSKSEELYRDKLQEILDKEIKLMEDTFGENMNLILSNAGFSSLDQFVDLQLRPSIALQLEMESHVSDNIDNIVKEYKVKDISLFSTDDEALSNTIIEELNSGVEPSKINIEGKGKLAEMLSTKSLDTDSTPLNKLLSTDIPFGTPEKVYDEEANIYYIVVNHDTKFIENIDPVLGILVETENYTETYTAQQFKDINFNILDPQLKKYFNEMKPGYLN